MTRALILTAPRALSFDDQADTTIVPDQVRIKTLYSGISAGTELTQYRGTNPFMHRQFDETRRMFIDAEEPSWTWPVRNLGYEEVGEIIEVGADVTGLSVGQHVYGTWNHKTHHVAPAEYARDRLMPEGADARCGIFSHIGAVALNGVHDANIRIGDIVAVFGLGVPGQIVAQAARASGAHVIAIDPDPLRRQMAETLGAHVTLDSANAAEAIKDMTNGRGADCCIEVSGAPSGLSEAIRAASYSSRVIAMGFFQGDLKGVNFAEEFHHNRIQLVCSQISGVAPESSYRWSKPRLWRTAIELQHKGVLNLIPLITHVAPFAEAPTLFDQLDRGTPGIMQAMLEFSQ